MAGTEIVAIATGEILSKKLFLLYLAFRRKNNMRLHDLQSMQKLGKIRKFCHFFVKIVMFTSYS